MAQVSPLELLRQCVMEEIPAPNAVSSLVDNETGRFLLEEDEHLDFKETVDLGGDARSAGELAKDILGFSNAKGGLLVVGVRNDGLVTGHRPLSGETVRRNLGPFIGTRVIYELGATQVRISGRAITIPFILVPRAHTAYPHLLRQDVELKPGLLGKRKVKYLRGSLPYREGSETKVWPPGADVTETAKALGFAYSAIRTRSSFIFLQDRPTIRLYDHINDRFVGREEELRTILPRFHDPRGRGVSIAGLGGVGKTELAIELVKRLYEQRRFGVIYSGSAKRSLLGPGGEQQTDPAFTDFPTFLKDLCAWLGFDPPSQDIGDIERFCDEKLAEMRNVLFFVDNLETVEDSRLFQYLDERLPQKVWLLTTSRVQKVKNYIYAFNLREMAPRDAARLLRLELNRQGLSEFASQDIKVLEDKAKLLLFHPMAIRWFAWACTKAPNLWETGPKDMSWEEVEAFCVAQTFGYLGPDSMYVLATIASVQELADVDWSTVSAVSRLKDERLEQALFELESAGLMTVAVSPESGRTTYGVVRLAIDPVRDMARRQGWEGDFASRFRAYSRQMNLKFTGDPLLRYITSLDPGDVRSMPPEQVRELKARITRVNQRPHEFQVELAQLEAECERWSGNPITADGIYRRAAETILGNPSLLSSERFRGVLLEAATVAKQVSETREQVSRAVRYLQALAETEVSPLRVHGMLAELYASLRDAEKYERHKQAVENLLGDETLMFSETQREHAQQALVRAQRNFRKETH